MTFPFDLPLHSGNIAIAAAVADRQTLAERSPDNRAHASQLALSQGLQAWILAMAPDPSFRNSKRALELARLAIRVEPNAPENLRALGAAAFRSGAYGEAIETLTKAGANQNGDEAVGYLLAMALWKQEDREAARDWLAQTEQLAAKRGGKPDVNIEPIRREARALIQADD